MMLKAKRKEIGMKMKQLLMRWKVILEMTSAEQKERGKKKTELGLMRWKMKLRLMRWKVILEMKSAKQKEKV